jgi:hypothetical protein
MIGAALAVIPAVVLDATVENGYLATVGAALNWAIWLAFAPSWCSFCRGVERERAGSGDIRSMLRWSS